MPPAAEPDQDWALREQLRRLSRSHPRWGYRRAHAQLLQQGWVVNRKAVQWLWREEGLRVPSRRRKRQRLGASTCPVDRLAAERPDHVWALDYQFDQTTDREDREVAQRTSMSTPARPWPSPWTGGSTPTPPSPSWTAWSPSAAPHRGSSRCDSGPELTANALRDWCRFTGAGTSYIEPGAPWQNRYVESFGGRLRDELPAVEAFTTLLEAQVLVEDWWIEYNTVRPHSALGYLTPTDYAKTWAATHPALS